MKVVILAGGLGSRLSEETELKPKPMVEIGGRPILWHIMQMYAHHGFGEFLIALGYKGEVIKRYFRDYHALNGSMTIDLCSGQIQRHDAVREDWRVHLIETGAATQTGGRVRRMQPYLAGGPFMVTYGDGVSDVDLGAVLAFHRSHGKLATVTAVRPPARFGGMVFDGDLAVSFIEKPQIGEGWINAGFFIFEPQVLDYISGDDSSLEAEALTTLAAKRQLAAYRHDGFWQPMDTLREKRLLETLWQSGERPWQTWEDEPGRS